ncbi:DUF1257 domain-containing protein [Phragmitibacter flavus]|uniref:DUF1257 domain-containing protein n=1 Tax=Phragmitibacter flavus TaxID=2576071 RepID=A0A5R8KH79_9BACT|nr:DUF1257 domain-containing protein [Phragmitibacter flavus]TLD71666.1 DUF1257 domain-containing protein [Phragmitibacter flavus]
MSHFVTIQTQIRDVAALQDACTELGVGLEQNANARGFLNQQRHGDYVIRLRGPYDIAAKKLTDSDSYELSTDWWDGHVEKEVGKDYGHLLQLYAVHKTMREARKKHLRVTRRQEQDGNIKLILGGS